jgi:hypothetical protein
LIIFVHHFIWTRRQSTCHAQFAVRCPWQSIDPGRHYGANDSGARNSNANVGDVSHVGPAQV